MILFCLPDESSFDIFDGGGRFPALTSDNDLFDLPNWPAMMAADRFLSLLVEPVSRKPFANGLWSILSRVILSFWYAVTAINSISGKMKDLQNKC